jgi:hypothetical protein
MSEYSAICALLPWDVAGLPSLPVRGAAAGLK